MDASRVKAVRAQLPITPGASAQGTKPFGSNAEASSEPANFLTLLTGLSTVADTAPATTPTSTNLTTDGLAADQTGEAERPLLDAAAFMSNLGTSRDFSERSRPTDSGLGPSSADRDLSAAPYRKSDTQPQNVRSLEPSALPITQRTPAKLSVSSGAPALATARTQPAGYGINDASFTSADGQGFVQVSDAVTAATAPSTSSTIKSTVAPTLGGLPDMRQAAEESLFPTRDLFPEVQLPQRSAGTRDTAGVGAITAPGTGEVAADGIGALSLSGHTSIAITAPNITLPSGFSVGLPTSREGLARIAAHPTAHALAPVAIVVADPSQGAKIEISGPTDRPEGSSAQSLNSLGALQAAADVAPIAVVDTPEKGYPPPYVERGEGTSADLPAGETITKAQAIAMGQLVAEANAQQDLAASNALALSGVMPPPQEAMAKEQPAPHVGGKLSSPERSVARSSTLTTGGLQMTAHSAVAMNSGDIGVTKPLAAGPVVVEVTQQEFSRGSAGTYGGLVAETASIDKSTDVQVGANKSTTGTYGRSTGRQSSVAGGHADPKGGLASQGGGNGSTGTDRLYGPLASTTQPTPGSQVQVQAQGVDGVPLHSERGVPSSDMMGASLFDDVIGTANVSGVSYEQSADRTTAAERRPGEIPQWDSSNISLERDVSNLPQPSEGGVNANTEERVTEQVTYWINQETQNAELTVTRDGAPVEVSVSLAGNEAHITFRSDQEQTRDLLDRSMAQLSELLRSEGLVLSGVSVGTSAGQHLSNGAQDNGAKRRREDGRQIQLSVAATETGPVTSKVRTSSRSVDVFV